MNARIISCAIVSTVAAVGVCPSPAEGCGIPTPPVNPPPRVWTMRHTPTDLWVWIELRTVFSTTAPHNCTCGLGLGSIPTWFDGVESPASVGVFDPANPGMMPAPIAEFDTLELNTASTAGWRDGPPTPDRLTGSPQVQNWFGFGGVVQAVTPPPLEPGRVFVVCFRIRTLPVPDPLPLPDWQVGMGEGDANFAPLFGVREDEDSHFASYSSVPAPGAVAMVLVGVGAVGSGRRRSC